MRILIALVSLVALAWGGYWYIGALAMERAFLGWFEDRHEAGWLADVASVETRGFPNRFDTTLTGVQLADPNTGVAWTAPFFQILSLSYKPHHIIAAFPTAQSVATPNQTIEITSASSRGSFVFRPDTDLEIDRISLVVEEPTLTSTDDWWFTANKLALASRQKPEQTFAHDIAINFEKLVPGGSLTQLSQNAGLPDEFVDLVVEASATFDGPWNRHAIEQGRPQPTDINIANARAEWGELLIQFAGDLEIDREGIPTGSIAVQAQNWREMLNLAVASGALEPNFKPTIEAALTFLAGMSGNPSHIDAKLNFRNGMVALGPIPIGPAPRLKLR